MTKFVYSFEEGKGIGKEILGGKGSNMADMVAIGLPVPAGFTLTTQACQDYYKQGKTMSNEIITEYLEQLKKLEEKMGKTLGDPEDPLLVSVRSGAAVSMPGMMDTVLNLGLTKESVLGLSKKTGNERFAYDAYRRFINMFGNVVMEMEHHDFEAIITKAKETKGVEFDTDLTAEDLKKLCEDYAAVVLEKTGKTFPQDPKEQLKMAIEAVFRSWNNPRAISYRKLNDLAGYAGTAVNVQAMVFGNMGDTSGTGVCFSRNPSTGENRFYGEYLMNAQGEDVVAGIRTPKDLDALEVQNPTLYKELCDIRKTLEKEYKDMQDMEFTIQEGKLYMLQTRSGKRTAAAAVRIAVEMVDEGLIDEKTAVLRVDPAQLDQLLHKQLDPIAKEKAEVLAKGLPASPGAAVGTITFDADTAVEKHKQGEKVLLVRTETSPEDIMGMDAAQGILTSRGGMTSHAAVVARGMGKPCVAGCTDAKVSEKEKKLVIGTQSFTEGDYLTLDGSTGQVIKGHVPVVDPELSGDFAKLMEWADSKRTLKIRTNADTPKDSEQAVKFGAEGIGLCRTEHMFFEGKRIQAVREMILSETKEGREKALATILPFQKQDFAGLFKVMKERPVTIRLLDPPLHEFLPQEEKEQLAVADELGVSLEQLKAKISDLHEFNPMLGHRGCRLGITYPEITEMQTRAIIEAACEVSDELSITITPEIMVPLVGAVKELENQKALIVKTADAIIAEKGSTIKYMVGTMIEVPRAAVTADEIAKVAEFFSFGTNDLTQMGCGFSRDDAGKFLPEYVDLGIYEKDPFQSLDQTGIGKLMKIAVKDGKSTRENIKLGICGEHGGDPASIEFCHKIGLNYVSCSPYRVPIARLAAAQAALKEN